jgi:hypothetical protein
MNSFLRRFHLFILALPLSSLAISTASGVVQTDWTIIDETTDVATGTLPLAPPVVVTFNGTSLLLGSTTPTGNFNYPLFDPPLPSSDFVGFLGSPNPTSAYSYTIAFSQPVKNPRLHLQSMASNMTFSAPIVKLSGTSTFVVDAMNDTVLHGVVDDNPSLPPNSDANGTIVIPGLHSAITFDAACVQELADSGDLIRMQILAIPEPSSVLLVFLSLLCVSLRRLR